MANNRPTHRAFAVRDREDADAFWTRIGSAFAHQDGRGFNVMLDALPVDGRVVLREFNGEEDDGNATSERRPVNQKGRTKR